MSVDDIIRTVHEKARGRTRYQGQDPGRYWDEILVAEIERLRETVKCRDARIARLEAAYREAVEDADEGWMYASDYFRDKWGWDERSKAHHDRLAAWETGKRIGAWLLATLEGTP